MFWPIDHIDAMRLNVNDFGLVFQIPGLRINVFLKLMFNFHFLVSLVLTVFNSLVLLGNSVTLSGIQKVIPNRQHKAKNLVQ